jgi:hypothetical protein
MVFLEVAEKIRNQQEQLAGSHCQKFVVNGSARRILEEKSDSLLGKFLRNSLRLSSLIQLRSTTLILCKLNSFQIQFNIRCFKLPNNCRNNRVISRFV